MVFITVLSVRNSGMRFFYWKRVLTATFLFFFFFSLTACGSKDPVPVSYAVTLEVWGVFDDSSAYTPAIEAYKSKTSG